MRTPEPATLRDRLGTPGVRRVRIACEGDAAVVSSLNTPGELEKLRVRSIDVALG